MFVSPISPLLEIILLAYPSSSMARLSYYPQSMEFLSKTKTEHKFYTDLF